uniref:VWFA domain-containing protein n=1 Tax=Bos mutus grunniens TaxID=30521 RepID=A0A8B9X1E3_BOSMU
MIICLTDGTLEEKTLKETVKEADKARQMGATVYCVGVKNFEEHQLIEIADSPYHVFAVNQGFKALKDIVDPLETKSCIEITSVEPSDICVGDEYELMISGKGFNNAKNEDEVICRFKFKDKLIGPSGKPSASPALQHSWAISSSSTGARDGQDSSTANCLHHKRRRWSQGARFPMVCSFWGVIRTQ